MDIYALDKDFKLVSISIPYTNLQWNRKYYEAGDFAVQLPQSVYSPDWTYIGTKDRPELGMIQKVQITGNNDVDVLLSGFFCEKMLDDKTCYPRYVGDATNTETAVRNIFTKFKDDLPITLGAANSPLLGDRTQSDFTDDQLGDKIYRILQTRELSYSVLYDFVANKLTFSVWKGKDRTQSQNVNPYQSFSEEFGTIRRKTVSLDNSDYKNYAIVPCDANDDGIEQKTYYVDMSEGGYKREIVFDFRSSRPEENQSVADFKDGVVQEATERLMAYLPVEDINIDPVSDEGYMTDYDLGDKVDVILSDVGVSLETRIIEVFEVFKAAEGHTITIGLGNKRITNMQRLVNSIR